MLKRINDALPGLVLGIVLYGVTVQLAGMWFAEDKLAYTIGLWYGIAIAVGMGIHIAVVIHDTVMIAAEDKPGKRAGIKSALRYFVVVILFLLLGYLRFGNLIMAIVGLMGLKVGAYIQPFLNKIINKLTGSVDAGTCEEDLVEADLLQSGLQGEPVQDSHNENKEEVTM